MATVANKSLTTDEKDGAWRQVIQTRSQTQVLNMFVHPIPLYLGEIRISAC